MSHTKTTPWQQRADFPFAFESANGVPIGECYGNTVIDGKSVAEHSAAFICRAVNAHDALVSALEHLLSASYEDGHEAELKARAALKLAKE